MGAAGPHRVTDPDPAIRHRHLLSRYAQSLTWLARYMERIENLARILDVTDTFVRDSTDGEAVGTGWRSVVQINADEDRFFARHAEANARTVPAFYVLDRGNPTSIVSTILSARENARTLRPLISTEMWVQINVFFQQVRALGEDDIAPSRLSGLCATLKEACQLHTGITEGTFFRDQGWAFYSIGKYLERADQTTRLVDIKFYTLLPSVADVGSQLDISQWNAVLRAAAGYHAFRRIYPTGMSAATVAGFLLLNRSFARSLSLCIWTVQWHLGQLRSAYGLRPASRALERLDTLRASLVERDITGIIAGGLHEFLDWAQQEMILLHRDVAGAFWEVRA